MPVGHGANRFVLTEARPGQPHKWIRERSHRIVVRDANNDASWKTHE